MFQIYQAMEIYRANKFGLKYKSIAVLIFCHRYKEKQSIPPSHLPKKE